MESTVTSERPVVRATWRKLVTAAFLLLIGLRFLAAGFSYSAFVHSSKDPGKQLLSADIVRYQQIAQARGRPYRDFQVEYPPLDYLLIRTIGDAPVKTVATRLAWFMLLADLAAVGALWYGWGRRAAFRYLVLGLPLLLFIYLRLDLFTVALTAGAFAVLRRNRNVLAGSLLGLATLSKVWPILLLPAFLVQRRTRAAVSCLATVALVVVPWVGWAGISGVTDAFVQRTAGWHTESTVGSVIWAFTTSKVFFVARGLPRIGVAPFWAKALLLGAGLLIGLLGWRWVAQRRARGIPRASLLAVAGLLVASPALAIQYMSWLLPWAAADDEEKSHEVRILTFGVMLTTALLFLRYVGRISSHRFAFTVAFLLARNALLVLLLVSAAAGLWTLSRSKEEVHSEGSVASGKASAKTAM